MILDEILKNKRAEIEKLKEKINIKIYTQEAFETFYDARNFKKALKPRSNGEAVAFKICSIIAELKKASPSKGVFIHDYKPEILARKYENAGASALSVLTDKKFFMGDTKDIIKVRNAVKLPILRKDFIIDEIQIFESKIIGADAILLILKAISKENYLNFLSLAKDLSLDVLVEVSDEYELDTALMSGAEIIGINNRDLTTFKTDLSKTINLAKKIAPGKIVVAESGIQKRQDIEMLIHRGINSFLIGEALVASEDVEMKIKDFLAPYPIDNYYMDI
ncbi:MAG: indole-3-glycerol phosphate synthase TrpC [Deltaproteobacteria bacterium]|nr:indole-3-glycerol phosphate synthase TrpC [Deltaproteobacteria bacterium]